MVSKYFILLFLIKTAYGSITVDINPECEASATVNCSSPWLIEVLNQPSLLPNATEYHHLWGASGAPSVISAQTKVGTKLSVDWEALGDHKNGSVSFDSTPLNVFGVSITHVILYNDAKDEGSIINVPIEEQYAMPAELFDWKFNVTDRVNASSATVTFFATSFNGSDITSKGGIIAVTIKNHAEETRSSEFPKLQVKPSASNVDVILDHFSPNISFGQAESSEVSKVRLALRLALYSSENKGNGSSVTGFVHSQDQSQDDEFSPGVFKLDDLTTPRARKGTKSPEGGYLQWRPVAYYNYIRDVSKSTLPTLSQPSNSSDNAPEQVKKQRKEILFVPDFVLTLPFTFENELSPVTSLSPSLQDSLAYAVFGEHLLETLTADTVVSFGATGDGYYSEYKYTVWTFTVGSGSALEEGLSVGVLITLLCGVALPLTTLLVAGFFVKAYQCKKSRRKRDALLENEQLNEDA